MPTSFNFRHELLNDDWDLARGFLVEEFDRLYAALAASQGQTAGLQVTGDLSVAGSIGGTSSFIPVGFHPDWFFGAVGGSTWTVQESDILTFGYSIVKKMMTLFFDITATSIGGTATNILYIGLPIGFVTRTMTNLVYLLDNGVPVPGVAIVQRNQPAVAILRVDNAAFAASTNNTGVRGQITFEII